MKNQIANSLPVKITTQTELDLVVPFTDPALTRTALAAAGRLGGGLNAAVRLVRIQLVPYPRDLDRSPVPLSFLSEQLKTFRCELPLTVEIRLARELQDGLVTTLHADSVVVLASKKRLWRTRTESLAAALRRAGYKTVLVYEGGSHA